VVALSLAGGTATGASMNPARTFGPAIWNWDWTAHWLYWVAPMSGAFLSATFYRAVFWRPNPKDLIAEAQIIKKTSL
jgi:aquaporin related protein